MKVEYEFINKQQSPYENSSLSEESKTKAKELNGKPQKYVLLYLDGNSFFKNINTLDGFSKELSRTSEQKGNTKLEKVNSECVEFADTKIFHHKNEKGFYQYHKFHDEELYHYSEPKVESINYTNETSYVDIYKCNLVEVTYNNGFIAKIWYTEDIPISSGPYAFGNFPGLVLKVKTANMMIFATKVSSFENEKEMETINKKLTVYNDDDFQRKRNEPKVIETREVIRQ